MNSNERESGARKLQPLPPRNQTDQNAGMPKKPALFGLTEPVDDTVPEDGAKTEKR